MAECPQKPADGGKNAGKGGKSKKGKGKGKWGGKGTMNMLSEGDQTDFALCIDEKPDQRILDYLELMECSPCSGDGWKKINRACCRRGCDVRGCDVEHVLPGSQCDIQHASEPRGTSTSNAFELLVVDDQIPELELEPSDERFPSVNLSAVLAQHKKIRPSRAPQGASMSDRALEKMVKEIEANNISVRKTRVHRVQRAQALDMLDEPTPPKADSHDKTIVQIKPETIDAIMSLSYVPSHEHKIGNQTSGSEAGDIPTRAATGKGGAVDGVKPFSRNHDMTDDQDTLHLKSVGKTIPRSKCVQNDHNVIEKSDPENPKTLKASMDNIIAVVDCVKKLQADLIHKMEEHEIQAKKFAQNSVCDPNVEVSRNTLGQCSAINQVGDNDELKNPHRDDFGKALSNMIFESTGDQLLVLTDQPASLNAVDENKRPLKWVKVATVLDSGACRHVTPKGVFSLNVIASERSRERHNYYGPAGDPIPNLGGQDVKGTTESGHLLNIGFDVAKITRPLASVAEIVRKNYRVVFDTDGSFIEDKKTGKWIDVRQEGSLYYLDLWVQVPEELATSPFVRQVA